MTARGRKTERRRKVGAVFQMRRSLETGKAPDRDLAPPVGWG
jgi:hypothetical protein